MEDRTATARGEEINEEIHYRLTIKLFMVRASLAQEEI